MAVQVATPGFGVRVGNFFRGMATWPGRIREFYGEVGVEMRKVTWPDRAQTQDATWRIIVFVLGIGFVIWVMDIALQFLLVRLPASILSGR